MNIRPANTGDIPRAMEIFDLARAYMRLNGNHSQWINGYPSRELVESDVEKGNLFVMEDETGIHCVFAFIIGDDPTYKEIFDGAWKNDEPYGTVHRIGSDGSVKGAMAQCLEFCKNHVSNIRIDTHSANLRMQETLARLNFEYCGVIYIEDGTPRMAYQFVV